MVTRLTRLFVAAPLVVLLGASMAAAASPEGDVTTRDREVVARLTRGGMQRFDADGSHGILDGLDGGTPATLSTTTATTPDQQTTATAAGLWLHPGLVTMLGVSAGRPRVGDRCAPPTRGRAPPRR